MKKIFPFVIFVVFITTGNVFSQDWSKKYVLKNGNTHIHSIISEKARHLGSFSKLSSVLNPIEYFDHSFSPSPEELCKIAKSAGLNFICITDHDCAQTAKDRQELLKLAKNTNSDSFALIPGFEWTASDYQHLNIFGTNKFVSASASFADYGIIGIDGKIVLANNLNAIYKWMTDIALTDKYLVSQWNHPGYTSNNFNNFQISKEVNSYMALIEVRSGPSIIHTNISKEEINYQKSIQSGCYPSPTIGNDNFGIPDPKELKKYHTSVWVVQTNSQNSCEQILTGLKERKVYASEDSDFVLKLWSNTESCNKTYYLGDMAKLAHGDSLILKTKLHENNESVGDVRLITVKKNSVYEGDFDPNRFHIKETSCYLTYKCHPESDVLAYYLKIIQDDGDIIISAPIFIDWKKEEKKYLSVVSTSPAINAKNVNPYRTPISICFDKQFSTNNNAIHVVSIDPPVNNSSSEIKFDPEYGEIKLVNYEFAPKTTYHITINNLAAIDGSSLKTPFVLTFTTSHDQSMKKIIKGLDDFVKNARECSKFSSRINICERVIKENGRHIQIGKNKTYLVNQEITIFIEIFNIQNKYQLPCRSCIKIIDPCGSQNNFVDQINKNSSTSSCKLNYTLNMKGNYKVFLYINETFESSCQFNVK